MSDGVAAQTAPVENTEVKQPDVKERLKKSLFGGEPVSEQVSDDTPASSVVEAQAETDEGTPPEQAGQDDTQPEKSQEPRFTVRVDGKEQEVPLSELTAGYQRNADYTQKSQKLSAEQKAIEATKGEVGTLRERMVKELDALSAVMQAQLPTQQDIQKAVSEGRVADAMQMQLAIQNHQTITNRQKELSQQSLLERQSQYDQMVSKEREALVAKLPEYAKEEAPKKLASYLITQGISQQEADNLADHRAVVIAHKAMLWDELQAKTPDAQKKLEAAPKLNKPSARQDGSAVSQERFDQAKKSFLQAGSVKSISSADRKALAKRLGLN